MRKKLIIIPPTLLLLALGGLSLLSVLVNKDKIKNEFVTAFKSQTGMTLEIQGEPSLQIFPLPHVVMNSLYVTNVPGAASSFLLSMKSLDIVPSFSSLFGSTLTIRQLKASGLDIELEKLSNGQLNWKTPAPIASSAPGIDITSVVINDAVIHYTDTSAASLSEYKDINLSFTKGSDANQNALTMSLIYNGKLLNITGIVGSLTGLLSSGVIPANLSITNDKSTLTFAGDAGLKNNNYFCKGNLALTTDDITPWINLWRMPAVTDATTETSSKPVPLQAKADITTDDGKVQLPNLSLTGAIAGTLQVEIASLANIDIKGTLDAMDMESIMASRLFDATKLVTAPVTDADFMRPEQNIKEQMGVDPSKSLLNALGLTADIKITDATYNGQHIKDGHIILDMAKGEMSVTQASMLLPGNSRLIFTGLGKEGYQGFALEGQVDIAGDNFAEMLDVLKPKGFAIPAEDFKRFRMRSNTVLSSHEIRLSELAARIENMAITGGIVASLEDRTKIQAALRVGGVNIDNFITLWGLKAWETSFLQESRTAKSDSLLSLWLAQLGFDLRVNASLEQYTLGGNVHDRMDFKLGATQGKLSIEDIKTSYNGSQLAANIGLDVTGNLPHIDISLAADTLDTATFLGLDKKFQPSAPTNEERWSSDEFNLRWLELLTGTYHLKFGNFKMNDIQVSGLEAKGSLNEGTLIVDNLAGSALGAAVVAKATFKGGKIPVADVAVSITNLDAQNILNYFPILQGITGKYNFNTRLQTNGNNLISWISNLRGNIGVGGRDVLVHGFNLPGIIHAVAYVRTVADILNVVKRAFPGGDTLFSTVEGQWTIVNGKISLANTKLATDDSKGTLSGEVDLVNWKTQNEFTFNFDSLDAAHPPAITINFSGDLNAPEKALDTRALEQYVTNKTSEKMFARDTGRTDLV